MVVELRDVGVIAYDEALSLQRNLHARALAGDGCSVVLCEHPHVYTLGKSGKNSNLLIGDDMLKRIGATFYKSDRGGDITYHGYGQLVGYPIVNIEELGLGVRGYIEALESAIIAVIASYGITGTRVDGRTGVWVESGGMQRKICAIGVYMSRYVSMHGFALNVNTDLRYFDYINPCGFAIGTVTSIAKETGREIDMVEVKKLIVKELATHLRCKIE